MKSFFLIVSLSIVFIEKGFCQDTIFLKNPSFEKSESDCEVLPEGWKNFGNDPTVRPSSQPNCFEITKAAKHGKKYVSLCISKRDGSERIGQIFEEGTVLKQGFSYKMSVSACTVLGLKKEKKVGKKQVLLDFSQPAVLEIWGYYSWTQTYRLLTQTEFTVENLTWETVEFEFSTGQNEFDGVFFALSFDKNIGKSYNGVVMVDNCSPIVEVVAQKPKAAVESPENLKTPVFQPEKTSAAGKNLAGNVDSLKKTGLYIEVKNPSFEGLPGYYKVPENWMDVGPDTESPPDTQPGMFSCTKDPSHGETYLGMVVRDNETCEGVGQHLSEPLLKGSAYLFSMDLCRSPTYVSLSRLTGEQVNYAVPCVLKIYGAINNSSSGRELLAATPVITKTDWERHNFVLKPQEMNYRTLILELDYKKGSPFATNGNMLLDNCSQIYELSEH